jgi:CheY-like chemotaxis protein
MPAMDGLQLLEHIRTDEITSHLPVILLTARTDQATAARAARLGANRYLCKPVMVDQLVAAIDAALVEAPAETPRVLVLRPRFA